MNNLSIGYDKPVLYTDHCYIQVNGEGCVFSFTQASGKTNEVDVIARVGISTKHAKELCRVLTEVVKNEKK